MTLEFVENEGHPPTYFEITYKDFLELQRSGKLSSKFQLDIDVNKELNMPQTPCPLLLLFSHHFPFWYIKLSIPFFPFLWEMPYGKYFVFLLLDSIQSALDWYLQCNSSQRRISSISPFWAFTQYSHSWPTRLFSIIREKYILFRMYESLSHMRVDPTFMRERTHVSDIWCTSSISKASPRNLSLVKDESVCKSYGP